jgi:predicted DNA-binding transcriptional regulator AlpA
MNRLGVSNRVGTSDNSQSLKPYVAANRCAKMSAVMTTAPIEHQRTVDLFPEFLRIPDVEKLYGLRRSKLYELLTSGEVKSVTLRKKGARTGVRLVSTQSLRDFLNSQMEEQNSG